MLYYKYKGVVIIGYLSFDASVKIYQSGKYTSTKNDKSGAGGLYGYFRHIDRKTDKMNGKEVHHSNENINADFTMQNESYYKDKNGNWVKTCHSSEMVEAVHRRIIYAKEHGARIYDSGKNDTTIVRPLIIQLDEETISQHENTWIFDTIEELESMFGKENIVGFCVHRDETSTHIHVVFTPVYEYTDKKGNYKCSVSQTKFFRSPKELAGMHKQLRVALQDKGYDIEQENKPIEEQLAGYVDKDGVWHQQGLTPDQLKQLTDRDTQLKIGEIEMRLKQDEIARLEEAMKSVQEKAKQNQEQLDNERKSLDVEKANLEKDKMTVQSQMQTIINEKVAVEQMKKETEAMMEQAYDTASICTQILNDEKNLNGKFLEFLDRESERTKKPIRQAVESLYKKFQNERKANLSSWSMEMLRVRDERKKNGKTGTYDFDIIDTDSQSHSDYGLTM